MKDNNEELQRENRNMRYLRLIVDLTAAELQHENTSLMEALKLMRSTKQLVLSLFPGKEETYEMIYQRRFERILHQRLQSN